MYQGYKQFKGIYTRKTVTQQTVCEQVIATHDPDASTSWEGLGRQLGLDIVTHVEQEIVADQDKRRRQNSMFKAVRKIAAAKLEEAKGWQELADVFDGSVGEMPQLLTALKKATNPDPEELASLARQADQELKPIEQGTWPTRRWACPVIGCGFPPAGSLRGCDSHIREAHTKQAYHCSFCAWSTFNLDSLQRHEKAHTTVPSGDLVAPGPSKQ